MEQIAQLKAMRDAAKARLMASPDWKLMVSLDALIPDLEKAFGLVADAPTSEEEGEPADEEPALGSVAESPGDPDHAAAIEAIPESEPEPEAEFRREEPSGPVADDETVVVTIEEFEVLAEAEAAPAPEPVDAGVVASEAAHEAAPETEPSAPAQEADMHGDFDAAIAAELDEFDIEKTLMDEISVLGEEPAPAYANGSSDASVPNGHDHEAHASAEQETEEDAVARALEELSNDLAREERGDAKEEDRGSIFTFRNQ